MTPLTELETKAVIDLLKDSLDYYWETLKEEHETLAEAMVAYDNDPNVTALTKLAPKVAVKHRNATEEAIKPYYED